MDLAERLKEIAKRLPEQLPHIVTEEATKNALVMPFLAALGYDVFNPREVVPEFVCDVGIKKGEKVDYAVMRDGKPILLVECKPVGGTLDVSHASQLYRYFSVTATRFALLTDGIEYQFYSDLDRANTMDSKPFFVLSMAQLDESMIPELEKFTKAAFDVDAIVETATALRYLGQIRRFLAQQWKQPEDEFVRFIAAKVYDGRITQAVVEQFTALTRQALNAIVSERLNERLRSAFSEDAAPAAGEDADVEVQTSEDELEAFRIVRAILREVIDVSRIALRDQKTYCAVLFDDNNRKPICRFWFNSRQKYLGTFDATKKEKRRALASLEDIYQCADELKATARGWLQGWTPTVDPDAPTVPMPPAE